MQIQLSRSSEVPLRQQLAEQIVFLITTGRLRAGEELPSVRALARQITIHHNTVSGAYQDLVRRGWLIRRRGSRLAVGASPKAKSAGPRGLDELINETIQRARDMGYSLQSLRQRVRERLAAQPPDHILVVEDERGLREIVRSEIHQRLAWPVEACSWNRFSEEPGLSIGAQVLTATYLADQIKPLVPSSRPAIPIVYAGADEQIDRLRRLREPSIITVASVSQTLLRTARSLLAPAIGRKHTLHELLLSKRAPVDLGGVDLAICDTIAFPIVLCSHKIHYRLVSEECLDLVAASLDL